MSDQLAELAEARVITCMQTASNILKLDFPLPSVNFRQRGRIAGSAHLTNNEIRLNKTLMKDNLDAFLNEVIPHEICHLLAYQLYGRVPPHGVQWQRLMQEVFGLTPQRQHTMDTSKVEGQTFDYQCQCGPVSLSIRRHNKVMRKQASYRCRKCGDTLIRSA